MSYATEHVAADLKAARQQKGLSQRALSTLSGVPQAHISKIESNAVDLRLSSLIAIAHALDLELALVPRKTVPALQSLARTAGTSYAPSTISKDLARAVQAATRAQASFKLPELERLRKQLAELSHLPLSHVHRDVMRSIRKAVETLNSSADTKALQDTLKSVTALRNDVVHNVDLKALAPARPAYRLEDDNDG